MPWTIAVPTGSFPDVSHAADGENQVDWSAAPGRDHDACTLCYSAMDAAACLKKLPGITVRTIPFDGTIPAGPSITILSPTAFQSHRAAIEKAFGKFQPPTHEQGFAIRSASQNGATQYLILGGGRVGAMYGVYELLKNLGFDWIGPDDHEQIVPAKLPDPLSIIQADQQPSFSVRGYWILLPPSRKVPLRGGKTFLQWMARNRMNLWASIDPDKPYCRKLGMLFVAGMHGDMAKYVPPEKYFKSHPEWYGLLDGQRRADDMVAMDNLCLSNPAPRQLFASAMLEDLIAGECKWIDLFNIGAADCGRWCECDNCKAAGNPTDLVFLLVHDCRQVIRSARAAGRLNREVIIGAIAYMETKSPPTKPLPADFDHAGTMMTFYPIERCYAHAFDDPACTELNVVLKNLYQGWSSVNQPFFRGQLCIGEYYNVSKFAGLAIPFFKTMARDIPWFYQSGARAMNYMHVMTSDWGTQSLTNMQFAAQLWDHTLDCDQWLAAFFSKRYGKLAPSMTRFYDVMERAMCNAQALRHVASLTNPKHFLFHTLKVKGNPAAPVTYFHSQHLQYDAPRRQINDGPSLLETIKLLDQARDLLDQIILQCDDPGVKSRLLADSRRFHYTHNVLNFTYRMVRIRFFENQGASAAAALEARYLRDLGHALQSEDVVTRNGCQDSEVLFNNGLLATYLSGPYQQIMKDYDLPIDPIPFDGVV